MKIFDMHLHAENTPATPEKLLENMEKAGVFGGCVFSTRPDNYDASGISFEERIEELLAWTKGYEDRLFPVLWIHPYEENIIEKIHIAVDKGVAAFKIICNNFYVYEQHVLDVLREIAKTGKPVIFHTGILWDGQVSSKYNRPVNWEALLEIEGLRFSMGHCSWPWIDECIALYGKFLNSLTTRNTAEMFFDITPGTPEIYRNELLTKLYTIGYHVGDNIMFGTDAVVHNYSSEWAEKWLKIDGAILDNLGVSKDNRERLYSRNLMRFLGKSSEKVVHKSPVPDNSNTWYPYNRETADIIKSWYEKLEFPKEYDTQFNEALETIKISDAITTETYNFDEKDGKRNLLSFLYMCSNTAEKYAKLGISEDILKDTLKDIVIWANIWSDLKGTLCLGELNWLRRHLDMKLFKLGRLQFCMADAEHDALNAGVKKGDKIIEIHIPATGPLNIEECLKSIGLAKEFFAKYFPDYDYKCFTCHSWLLDSKLTEILSPDSNILKFRELFEIADEQESDAILSYTFKRTTNRRNIKQFLCESSFAEKVKKCVLAGEKFHEALGIIKK